MKRELKNQLTMKQIFLSLLLAFCFFMPDAVAREKLNFNGGWRLQVGDVADAASVAFDDSGWQQVTLPYAFNGDEAFRKDIVDLTDTVCWYRKHFVLSEQDVAGKVFIEFEGARQGCDVWLNGRPVGFSDNGVMAFGFDLTPYAKRGDNVLAVRCDNSWQYRDRKLDSRYQWNDKNFNANYGGLPKNVFLHKMGKVYQTLPLYSALGTTGTYVYATDFDIAGRRAVVHVEAEVKNDDTSDRMVGVEFTLTDADGKRMATVAGRERQTIAPGETKVLRAEALVEGLHFWSWGYGYLYNVEVRLREGRRQQPYDGVTVRTGFRKTEFKNGMFYLNDRVLMVHGYAQRTSNEWPGVGLSVPAWLSDYSNALMVESGGNLVRWMHVTPWKQDVESCDRVGLLEAMPAGDAEKDVDGPRWQQRTELMRDAIIYNRNNPSIVFYEGGNESISRDHMVELKAIRDQYDPHGGRAIGSREMLDIGEAEYGGEMLYINKSGTKPMWAMEYCRDEGLRKYWDEQSYPYHKSGDGPLYRGKPALEYNRNMDDFARQMVERWHEYWVVRPGTGRRVSSGGVKIVFSDTNTHHRGEKHFRMSGVVDAMRLPKDAFYTHQVMWDGWVSPEHERTYIIGHWNYGSLTPSPSAKEREVVAKPVYVVSTSDEVELFVNGKSQGKGERSYQWLFTFNDVKFEAGRIEAVGSSGGVETSRYAIETAGEPYALKLRAIENPLGTKADGADLMLVEVEAVDRQGRRCPLDDRQVNFQLWGEARWIGGMTPGMTLPLECGVGRVLMRSTTTAGDVGLSVQAEGLKPAYLSLKTEAVEAEHYLPQQLLPLRLERGETPATASYSPCFASAAIASATAGSNEDAVDSSFDDNELSEWRSDGQKEHAWVTYRLGKKMAVTHLDLKLAGWRNKCYPLQVFAGEEKVWEGLTDATLGYCHLSLDHPVTTDRLTLRMAGPAQDSSKFGDTKELAGGQASDFDRVSSQKGKVELRIVEIDILSALFPEKVCTQPKK